MKENSNNERVYRMPFAKVYPLYVQKVERKGRTKDELDKVIFWLTGYDQKSIKKHLDRETNFGTFFAEANLNPNASKISGVICGIHIEEIKDKLVQKVRYLDKLVDELAKGKAIEKILRE